MDVHGGPDFGMEYTHPVLSILDHGKDLAVGGAEPEDIEAFAYQVSEERHFTSTDKIAIRGMVAEIHNRFSPRPYIPGLEFLHE